MTADDELCRVCGFKRSEHLPTPKGPLTHPREAKGEGTYVLRDFGTLGGGVVRDDQPWERWDFVPVPAPS